MFSSEKSTPSSEQNDEQTQKSWEKTANAAAPSPEADAAAARVDLSLVAMGEPAEPKEAFAPAPGPCIAASPRLGAADGQLAVFGDRTALGSRLGLTTAAERDALQDGALVRAPGAIDPRLDQAHVEDLALPDPEDEAGVGRHVDREGPLAPRAPPVDPSRGEESKSGEVRNS